LASDITLKDQYLWVSNRRLSALLAFAIQVGAEASATEAERGWVEKLRTFEDQAWPGLGLDLEAQFPTVEEKKYWARVFHDVARRIFLRQLGNHEVTYWQSSAIGDAYVTARLLTRAVQEVEHAWHPSTENTREADAPDAGQINIRL
jgi:hypothetical protein